MQDANVIDTETFSPSIGSSVYMKNLPLTFLSDGDVARVSKIRGQEEIRHHLENIGFVEGSELRVISQQSGNIIVEIKGTQMALDRSVASKIITC